MSDLPIRVGVLLSGRGSNFGALLEATRSGKSSTDIVIAISDNEGAGGLDIARDNSITAQAYPRSSYASKADHEAQISNALEQAGVELICLAGYMRILSADFVERWQNRILNIHPSLLPEFPGLNTHERALEAKAEQHGCTVHLVDAGMDTGPILAQSSLMVHQTDTSETLAQRVLKMEHRLYPKVLHDFCDRLIAEKRNGVSV